MTGNPFLAWNPQPRNGSAPDVLHVSPLSWSPGMDAVRHDVYFGADANDVNEAERSDTTGIYRGTLDANSISLPDLLEWNRTYSWRVDEQTCRRDDHRGRIWSFTTADFLSWTTWSRTMTSAIGFISPGWTERVIRDIPIVAWHRRLEPPPIPRWAIPRLPLRNGQPFTAVRRPCPCGITTPWGRSIQRRSKSGLPPRSGPNPASMP